RQSEGGMRDALSLLDQVLSACGPSASDTEVADALGVIEGTLVQDLVGALVARDPTRMLARVDEVFQRGLDLKRLAEELALELRHLFVTQALGKPPADLPDGEQAVLKSLAANADSAQVARLFDIVHAAVVEVGEAEQPKLALEMSLLKAIHLA